MRLRLGRPRCLLVIAPHPDDETIGAYTLMTRLQRRGVHVRVLVVTDGHASHPASRSWPHERLVAERRRETRRAMRRIGLGTADVVFLDLPDGRLGDAALQAERGISRAIRRAPRPLIVVAPARTDAHPDHRIVATAVAISRCVGVRRLSYPVWPTGQRLSGARALALTAQERLAKRLAIRSYRTQAGRIVDDPTGFAMTPAQIAAFSRPVEPFWDRLR